MMNFVAIDFETANNNPASACAIGLVVVENGVITREISYLLNPYTDWFSKYNIAVHGILPDDVQNAPRFDEIWHLIAPYLVDADLIVGHNIDFDMRVLKSCLAYSDIACRFPKTACTVKLSRQKLPQLINHKLSTVAQHFGIPLNHHEALSDARASALIMIELGE